MQKITSCAEMSGNDLLDPLLFVFNDQNTLYIYDLQ